MAEFDGAESPEILTAREALFEIRRIAPKGAEFQELAIFDRIEEIAQQGLNRTQTANFELSDQLADRLAEAHGILREWDKEGSPDNVDLESRTSEALALPPDIEAMVERRR